MKTNVVKALVVAVAAFVVVSAPLTTRANDGGSKKVSVLTDEQVNVKYIGSDDNNIIFKVEFENPTAEKFWLIIKNDAGDVVYHRQFTDAHFSKNVIFQKDDNDIHPTFVIRNSNNEIVRQFAVNTVVTQNTTVTKL